MWGAVVRFFLPLNGDHHGQSAGENDLNWKWIWRVRWLGNMVRGLTWIPNATGDITQGGSWLLKNQQMGEAETPLGGYWNSLMWWPWKWIQEGVSVHRTWSESNFLTSYEWGRKGKNSTPLSVFTEQMSKYCFIGRGIFVEERFGAQIKSLFKSSNRRAYWVTKWPCWESS